jgi:hypothetical protein
MKKALLAFGILLLIAGIALASLSSFPVSRWVTFAVDAPMLELTLNKAFEIQASNTTTYTLNLTKDDKLTITGAISQPETNRSIGARIDFSINDSSRTYHSYDKTSNVTFSWTVPQSGNYSFVFDNRFDNASKDVIVMVMKNWQEHSEYNMLVNTPLVGYWFLWVGVVVCAVGVALVILGLRKKLLSDPSSAVVFSG